MKVLHLYSDWRWTGPADPLMNLCSGLKNLGCDVTFAFRAPVMENGNSIENKIVNRNINYTTKFALNRYFYLKGIKDNFFDLFRIIHFIKIQKYDIVHMHLSHDYCLGMMILPFFKNLKLIRTNHKAEAMSYNLFNRIMLKKHLDVLVELGENPKKENEKRFDLSPNQIEVVKGTVDHNEFSPRPKDKDLLDSLNIKENEFLFGIVSRLQKRRKFFILLEALHILRKEVKNFKFIFIGRGGKHLVEIKKRIEELELGSYIIFTGYKRERYVDYVNLLDVKMFLVPGFDGSCRALMEAMSLEKPAIVSSRGILPELIDDGLNGYVLDEDSPENFAQKMLNMYNNRQRTFEMGKLSRQKILKDHTIENQALKMLKIYKDVLEGLR